MTILPTTSEPTPAPTCSDQQLSESLPIPIARCPRLSGQTHSHTDGWYRNSVPSGASACRQTNSVITTVSHWAHFTHLLAVAFEFRLEETSQVRCCALAVTPAAIPSGTARAWYLVPHVDPGDLSDVRATALTLCVDPIGFQYEVRCPNLCKHTLQLAAA